MRAAVSFLTSASKPDDAIYLTEFVTALFQVVASKRKRSIGSEYLRAGTAQGAANAVGVRHEDVTRLSFPDSAFNIIGTFEVLEHVPNYRQALTEFFRCLRPAARWLSQCRFCFSLPLRSLARLSNRRAPSRISCRPKSTAIPSIRMAYCVSTILAGISWAH